MKAEPLLSAITGRADRHYQAPVRERQVAGNMRVELNSDYGWRQRRADFYVSLNRMGNLSNANLEALASGACMVTPVSQSELEIDVDTDAYIPEDTALRFGAAEDIASLSSAILRLHRHPAERKARGRRAAALARELLPSWDKRVAQELAILERIASRPRAAGLQAKHDV